MRDLTTIISDHLIVSQSTQIKTQSLQANYAKNYASQLDNHFVLQDCEIVTPSLCDLAEIDDDCNKKVLIQQVKIVILELLCLFKYYKLNISRKSGKIWQIFFPKIR